MPNDQLDEKAIFNVARTIGAPEARAAYLQQVCGDDVGLADRVNALLQGLEKQESFLESPIAAFANTVTPAPLTEKTGTVIGPYKLLQQIGEGGFGVVYMAEQTEPVRRKVALKIIKPGMDTKEVIARFEAERQALALMDHPNIAKVLDAGATESGRPYFVMELVKGVPVIEYCDKNHLPASGRLKLFVNVCHAIQHAHQKGVIHRDLKPSNIMVTLHDGKPVPKVIDFGVSKALSQQLTEKTLFTAYGQMIGTPAYMSPEQAEMSGLDIDTRSDIYSLGVLLYELLTGGTPFDSKRLREAGYAEMQRIIREEEPPKPSTRLTTMGEESTVVSGNRGTDPKKLGQLVRGDLDWIVMKALDKDRNRRYETANGFAADIERFLSDEPVQACPPSATYRLGKFARRNKASMTVVTVAALALIAVAIGSTIAAGRFRSLATRNANLVVEKDAALTTATAAEATARDAQQDAEDARDQEKSLREDAQQQRERAEANFAMARSAVDEFLNHVTENELLTVPGLQPLRQELLSSAMEFYDEFARDEANASELLMELASAHYRISVIHGELGQREESTASNNRSIELYEQLRETGNDSREVRLGLARSYRRAGRYDETVSLCQEILEVDAAHADTRSLLGDTYNTLAIADKNDNDIAAALSYHQQALVLREGLVQEFPDNAGYLAELGGTVNNLGVLLGQQDRNREALDMFERAVGYSAEAYNREPQTIMWGRWLCIGLRNVAFKQSTFDQQEDALQSFQRQVAIRRKLAFENPAVPSLKGELYNAWLDLGNYQRQLDLTMEAGRSFDAARDVLENIPRETPAELFDLAVVYGALATPIEGSAEQPDEHQQAEQQRYADLAMETIASAVDDGYRNVNALQTHEYLAVLRERGDFQQIVGRLEREIQAEQLATSEAGTDEQRLVDRRQAVDVLRELIGSDAAEVRHKRTLAATLYSIGEIQIGLEQFDAAEESLREALEIRESLLGDQPGDLQATLDVLTVEYSLGRWDWVRGSYPEAHQRWQACLAGLLQLAETNRENRELQRELSIQERKICQHYGRIGLFPLAQQYAARSVEFRRVWAADIPALPSEGEFSCVLLLQDDAELTRAFFEQFTESMAAADYRHVFDLIHVVRGIAAVGDSELLNEQLLAHAKSAIDEQLDNRWIAVAMAMLHYHHGRYNEAAAVLSSFVVNDPQITFLDAAVAARLGDAERALERWEQAETKYQHKCTAALRQDVDNSHNGLFRTHWWQFAYAQVMRRLASEAISGQPAGDDPWQHLIQARGYRLIGEVDLADAELAAAAAAAPADPDVCLARAQLLSQWGEVERGEASWRTVIELAGDDPLPWIRRGRWYAMQGEQEKADADFAHAASLTPNELNRFLEAGWWVAGPYPADLDEFCPPEINPDPSHPVHAIDPTTGLSDEPIPWATIPAGQDGNIDLPGRHGMTENSSVYLLAQIYSPDERTELIRVGNANGIRVWWNGQLVLQTDDVLGENRRALRIPVALRQGRNQILIQTRKDHELAVNLGDGPSAQVFALAEQGQWQRAAETTFANDKDVFANEIKSNDVRTYCSALWMAAAAGDEQILNREQDRLLALATDPPKWSTRVHTALTLVLSEDPWSREHAEEILAGLRDQMHMFDEAGHFKDYGLRALIMYAIMLGNTDEAEEYLRQWWGGGVEQKLAPLRALIEHQRGQAEKAAAELETGLEFWEETTHLWYHRVWYVAVLRQAERQIHGTTERTDALVGRIAEAATRRAENSDPLTAAYDHLVYTYGTISSEATPAYPYLMRGRRLAELGRLDEAETDFKTAVELAPDDPGVRVACARFHADRGEVVQAAAGFDKALNLVSDASQRWRRGVPIDIEVARRDEVFDRLVSLRPNDHYLWVSRVLVLVTDGRLDEAAAAIRQADSDAISRYNIGAMLAILRGDQEELNRIRTGRPSGNHYSDTYCLGLAPTHDAMTAQLLESSERMLQQSDGRWRRLYDAVAQYRAGNLEEARALESSLNTAAHWPDNGVAYPVLAMIHHRLGNSETARRWLDKSAVWLRIHSVGALRSDSGVLGANNVVPSDWVLLAMVYDREARALIDGDEPVPNNDLAATPETEPEQPGTEEPETPDP